MGIPPTIVGKGDLRRTMFREVFIGKGQTPAMGTLDQRDIMLGSNPATLNPGVDGG